MIQARKCLVILAIGLAAAGGFYLTRTHPDRPGTDGTSGLAVAANVRRDSLTASETKGAEAGASTRQSAADQAVTALSLRITSCLSNPSEDDRKLEFLNELSRMAKADAPEFLKALEEFRKKGGRREEWSAFFRKWGEIDPNAAIAFLDQHSSENWAANSYQQVLRSWGIKDASRAQAWLNERSGEKYFNEALLGFLEGYATWDPKGATQTALASLEGSSGQLIDGAMETIATSVFRASFSEGLKDWFEALPSDETGIDFRKGAMRHVYSRLLQKDLADAAEWVAAQAAQPWRNDGVIAETAARLANSDPATAMKWVSAMPPSPRIGVIMGVGEIVRVWSRDPGTFEPWLETVRGTQVFEQAARDYAIEIARRDPNRAMHYATQVTNAHWRSEAIAAAENAAKK